MKALLFIFCAAKFALPQASLTPYTYILRISHQTLDEYACALLENTRAFHLEFSGGGEIKVFEGTVSTNELARVEQVLASQALLNVSQAQIEEPLIRSRPERLQLTIHRPEGWQDLFFQSSESQEPFKQWLQPLVRWLDGLHKLPHKEFSEDEGKQNCLPPRDIVLKKRNSDPPSEKSVNPRPWDSRPATAVSKSTPPPTVIPPPVAPLLRLYSFSRKEGNARQTCMLLAGDGKYHFEERTQDSGKPVHTEVRGGEVSPEELSRLRQLLDDPGLAKIRHHEPRTGQPLRVLGNMLKISIARPAGTQEIVLTSAFGKDFGPFYGGDADISRAGPLMKFVNEHVESNKTAILDKSLRNDCEEGP